MSEDIRKMIDKVKNFKQFVNEEYTEPLNRYLVSWGDNKAKYTWTVIANNENEAKQFVINDEIFLNGDDEKSLKNRNLLNVELLKQSITGSNIKGVIKKAFNDFYNDKNRHVKLG